MKRFFRCMLVLIAAGAGESGAAPPGRVWSPVETVRLEGHDGYLLHSIHAGGAAGLEMIGIGYGVTPNGCYGLQWNDSAWVVRWRFDHQAGYIVRALAPEGRHVLVWKGYAPSDPENLTRLFSTEVVDGVPGPIDTLTWASAYGGNMYAAAATAGARWVAWQDRSPMDLNRAEIRTMYAGSDQAWREGPTIPRNPSTGLAAAALSDTALLLVWGEHAAGLKWGILTPSAWTEGNPLPTPYWARVPRLSLRKGGGLWLGWLEGEEVAPYNEFATISSFVGGSWGPPEPISCGYPSAVTWSSDAFALSVGPDEYPAVAWNIYGGGGLQDHTCISCPSDSGPLFADAISSTSHRSGPQPAIDLNGDVWLAWDIWGNTTYWVHTYTRATASAPSLEVTDSQCRLTWLLSEPAPGSWWAVLRSIGQEPFTEVERVQAGTEVEMNWLDIVPNTGTVRYRIRRESLDARYQWLSPEVVLDVRPSPSNDGLRLVWTSSHPSTEFLHFTVLNSSPGAIDIRLHDVSGRLILRHQTEATSDGPHVVKLDLLGASPPVAPGLYLLHVADAAGRVSSSAKFVFLR